MPGHLDIGVTYLISFTCAGYGRHKYRVRAIGTSQRYTRGINRLSLVVVDLRKSQPTPCILEILPIFLRQGFATTNPLK